MYDVPTNDPSGILNASDIDRINNLPFFDNTSPTKETNTKEGALLSEKLASVKELFGEDPENPSFINYRFPRGLENPYFDIQVNQLKKKTIIRHTIMHYAELVRVKEFLRLLFSKFV